MKAVVIVIALAVAAVVAIVAIAVLGGDDLEARAGERVTVSGEVESFYPGAFTIGDSTLGDETLIIPGPGAEVPEAIRLRAGTPQVEATGTVLRKQDAQELIPGEQFEPFEDAAYLRAERIELRE